MTVYDQAKLMTQTRRLASEYYQATQQTLPVSNEIAKYDVQRLLGWKEPEQAQTGVDVIDQAANGVQVKSRVLFKSDLNGYRLGQINMSAHWQYVALVLLDPNYEPVEIYRASREAIEAAMTENPNPNRQKRGSMSVAKFKIIAEPVWQASDA